MNYLRSQRGAIIPLMLSMTLLLTALGFAIASVTTANIKFIGHGQKSQAALEIAEGGINYYLWHLSHNTTDYQDGTGAPASPPYGPYEHDFLDSDGKKIGTYTLYVTPPTTGSTVTTVKSIGKVDGLNGTRTVQAQLGIPSFANYSLLTGTEVWFGVGENANGPVHSNVGVHFDAVNNGTVTASNASYTPTGSFGGDGGPHNGVWGNGGPTAQWQYPVPTIDFSQVTADLQNLKTQAQGSGVYLANTGAFSVNHGYYLVLKNNGTIDIYQVTNQASTGAITTTFIRNQAAPVNGILYVDDNVWISGTYNKRITVVSGRLPDVGSTNTSTTIYDNLTYTAQDGTVAVGLIAQKDVAVARSAPNNLTINAALLAQKGHVWYPNYTGSNTKSNLTFYGAIASYDYWTWSWFSGSTHTDGYLTSTNTFDTNLTFSPPPLFPTTGSFTVLNWRELLTAP
ncbi:MAG TPA: hypothetical protein VMR98_01970 [Candidatus Polarisedimenticolaceae bacterium]|nr:hypothetical protein [Candidatus Polarisedimenticolaceae bacterium]